MSWIKQLEGSRAFAAYQHTEASLAQNYKRNQELQLEGPEMRMAYSRSVPEILTLPEKEEMEEFMRIDLYTKAILTVIALLLAAIAFGHVFPTHPVFAATNDYSYLSPQANEQEEFGALFIDMRNGNAWQCSLANCKLVGRFPFEKTR